MSSLCFWIRFFVDCHLREFFFAGGHMKIVVVSLRNEIVDALTSYSMSFYVLKVIIV